MLLDGEWHNREETIDVTNPFDGSLIDTVPSATSEDVDLAISSAVEGFGISKHLSAHERADILYGTASS
tara:strand:+ start:82 stop:288 length:207 start_codon:yes stop_codon:yes gene_type:complete